MLVFRENPLRSVGCSIAPRAPMTESKIKSAKELLTNGVPPRDVASNLGCLYLPSIDGFRPQHTLSVLKFPFSEGTPIRSLCIYNSYMDVYSTLDGQGFVCDSDKAASNPSPHDVRFNQAQDAFLNHQTSHT